LQYRWVKDKHKRLTDFAVASGGARSKYRERTFIELFSGPGRARIRGSGEFVDGSAVAGRNRRLGPRFRRIDSR